MYVQTHAYLYPIEQIGFGVSLDLPVLIEITRGQINLQFSDHTLNEDVESLNNYSEHIAARSPDLCKHCHTP